MCRSRCGGSCLCCVRGMLLQRMTWRRRRSSTPMSHPGVSGVPPVSRPGFSHRLSLLHRPGPCPEGADGAVRCLHGCAAAGSGRFGRVFPARRSLPGLGAAAVALLQPDWLVALWESLRGLLSFPASLFPGKTDTLLRWLPAVLPLLLLAIALPLHLSRRHML